MTVLLQLSRRFGDVCHEKLELVVMGINAYRWADGELWVMASHFLGSDPISLARQVCMTLIWYLTSYWIVDCV